MPFLMQLFWIFAGAPAHATQIQVGTVPCPLGEGTVKVYSKVAANTRGGFDSDLAAYSVEGQFRSWAVSTCPSSLFSLYGVDMDKPIDPAVQPLLRAALAEEISRLSDKINPPVWERYGIANRMYRELGSSELGNEKLGKGALFRADLLVEASWTGRDEAVGVYEGLEGPAATRALLDQGALELKKQLPTAQRKILLYNLARVAARGGYVTERDTSLRAFETAGPLTEKEAAAVARFKVGAEAERHYQDLAISALQEALRQPDLPKTEKLRAIYLLADLSRRRGRSAEALELYARLLADPDSPEGLREMAQTLSAELRQHSKAADEPRP